MQMPEVITTAAIIRLRIKNRITMAIMTTATLTTATLGTAMLHSYGHFFGRPPTTTVISTSEFMTTGAAGSGDTEWSVN